MCKKSLEPAASPCPRCRTDLTLLVDYMSNLDEHLNKADAALRAGELVSLGRSDFTGSAEYRINNIGVGMGILNGILIVGVSGPVHGMSSISSWRLRE